MSSMVLCSIRYEWNFFDRCQPAFRLDAILSKLVFCGYVLHANIRVSRVRVSFLDGVARSSQRLSLLLFLPCYKVHASHPVPSRA